MKKTLAVTAYWLISLGIVTLLLFTGAPDGLAETGKSAESVKPEPKETFSLQAEGTPLREVLGEIKNQCDVEVVGLEKRADDPVTLVAQNEPVDEAIKRLLRSLGEDNYAFEYSRTHLRRVSVMPKGTSVAVPIAPPGMAAAEPEPEKEKAVRILKVNEQTQAATLDLRQGDLIMEYDGTRIESAQQLVEAVKQRTAQDTVEMVVVRERIPLRLVLNGGLIGVNILTVSVPKAELGL